MSLALCDWRTTAPEDYTTSDHFSPVWERETLQVYYNPAHEFWFAKEMTEDDAILIEMYDSDAKKPESKIGMCKQLAKHFSLKRICSNIAALGTPHGSFVRKDAPECTRPRQSMEIRALVFT
jgi:hypothetical protein